MNEKMIEVLLEAAVDYINQHVSELHHSGGDPPKKQNLGGDITVDDVIAHAIRGDEFHLVVDRGILGAPKYRLPLAELAPAEEQARTKQAAPDKDDKDDKDDKGGSKPEAKKK